MNLLVLAAALFPGEEVPPPRPEEWRVLVELTQKDGSTAKVDLVNYEDGKLVVRTRDGLTAEVEESKVARLKILRVARPGTAGQPEHSAPPSPPPWNGEASPRRPRPQPLLPRTEEERKLFRNIREYLLPTPQRQFLYSEYKKKGLLEKRKREILDRLPGFTNPANALILLGDLLSFLYFEKKPKETIVLTLGEAASSIKDPEVRKEVVETLKFFEERWQLIEKFRNRLPGRRWRGVPRFRK